MTHAPSTYKIPTAQDWPENFNVSLLAWGAMPRTAFTDRRPWVSRR